MKKHKHIITTLLAIFIIANLNAQTLTDNIGGDYQYFIQDATSNLEVPANIIEGMTEKIWLASENGGAIPTDIYYHEPTDMIYIYGKRNIVVVNANTNELETRIPLTYEDADGNTINESSQFYPAIEETQYLDYNHFAYKPNIATGYGTLYCVSESLNIYAINTSNNTSELIINPDPLSFHREYYNCFIEYHDERIYLAYSSALAGTGSEFYVYDVADNYEPVGYLGFDTDKIRGMEINTSANEFFLSINDSFYSFTFDPLENINQQNVTQTLIGSYTVDNAAGNFLYINNSSLHKLFCFPNGGTNNQDFFVKDLSIGTVSTNQCPANITSTCFNGSDKIYLSYKSTEGNEDFRTISVLNYATLDSDDNITGINDLNTRTVSGNNYTLDMEMLNGQLLIAKESEVILFNPINTDVIQLKQGRNNYFSRVAENANSAYVLGTWSTDMHIFNSSGQIIDILEIGGITYKACHNTMENKIYFYNTHNQENSKVYILNTINNNVSTVVLDGSICDIEIDPITNNVLISSGDASEYIKIIDGNTNVLLPETQWFDLGHGYIGEMFISENNNLYSIIRENGISNPGVEIGTISQSGYSTVDYQDYFTNGYPIRGYFTSNNPSGLKMSDDYVYVVINIPTSSMSAYVGKFNEDDNFEHSDLTLSSGNYIDIVHLDKYVYVAKEGVDKKVVIIDQDEWTIANNITLSTGISDMEVNQNKSIVYVLHGSEISMISGPELSTEKITGINENCSSLKYNMGNTTLYVHLPLGCMACGFTSGGIYEVFDDNAGSEGWMFFPNDDLNRNRYSPTAYAPLHHDMIIDQLSHKVYYAGGGHSCINVVEQVNTYKLLLREDKEVTWLSIPRHYHTGGAVLPNSTPTSTVFDQTTIDEQYSILDLDYSLITGSAGNYTPVTVNAHWEPQPDWTYTTSSGNMNDIVSPRGYILELNPDWTGNNFLNLNGTIEDPNTSIPLYCGEENWVGYFIPEVQDVFDALGDELANLNVIKHQDWTCARNIAQAPCLGTKSGNEIGPVTWACSGRHNIKFGDMLMLTPIHDATMTWNWTGNQASEAERPEATYYVPNEQPTYTTMSIELDTTSNPQEIGAFVNDSCVGACSVLPEDTIVVMQAYLGEQLGDSVTFKEHFTSREINAREIKEYRVLNFDTMLKEERAIKTGEGEPLIVVSFKNGKTNEEQPNETETGFVVYPNPTKSKINFSLRVEEEVKLIISIFSINGKLVSKPVEQTIEPGFVTSSIKLLDNSGNELKPGIYILRANIGKVNEIRKLIIE